MFKEVSMNIENLILRVNLKMYIDGISQKAAEKYLKKKLKHRIIKYDARLNNYYLENGLVLFFNEITGQWNCIGVGNESITL